MTTKDEYGAAIQRIRAIPDPVTRIAQIKQAQDLSHTYVGELAVIHRDAVRELRITMTSAEVAEALGISVQRVGQLLS